MAANCQICGSALRDKTNRYCFKCSKGVRRKMAQSGYLQKTYVPPYFSEERGRKGMRDPRILGGVPC